MTGDREMGKRTPDCEKAAEQIFGNEVKFDIICWISMFHVHHLAGWWLGDLESTACLGDMDNLEILLLVCLGPVWPEQAGSRRLSDCWSPPDRPSRGDYGPPLRGGPIQGRALSGGLEQSESLRLPACSGRAFGPPTDAVRLTDAYA